MVYFASFVLRHINLCGLFNAKVIHVEEQYWFYLTSCLGNKRVHSFYNRISLKVNVIARLKFELTYDDVRVNPIYQPLHSGRIWHKVNF